MLLFTDLYRLFFPRTCHCCHRQLIDGETLLCLSCRMRLHTINDLHRGNPAEMRALHIFPFERGAAFCYYEKGLLFADLIKAAKYHGQPQVNRDLTRLFLPELDAAGWPGDISLILPIPIHWRRRMKRGYNQSFPIAQTLGRHWQIEVDTCSLKKATNVQSQVSHSYAERIETLKRQSPFVVSRPQHLAGHHVLIVDDVHTSGATLMACAQVLLQVPGVRLSFLTLGLTH